MTTTKRVALLATKTHGPRWHAHDAACADLGKRRYVADDWVFDATSVREIIEQVYPPGEFPRDSDADERVYVEDVRIHRCLIADGWGV